MTRDGRAMVAAALGLLIGAALCAVLIFADTAGAQETTTTTEPTTTTTEPPTTTSTVPDPPPAPEPVDLDHPLGSREAAQWLACLVAFTLGHVVTR